MLNRVSLPLLHVYQPKITENPELEGFFSSVRFLQVPLLPHYSPQIGAGFGACNGLRMRDSVQLFLLEGGSINNA
jgi:hypothetical protein